jgi:hypothetical protein
MLDSDAAQPYFRWRVFMIESTPPAITPALMNPSSGNSPPALASALVCAEAASGMAEKREMRPSARNFIKTRFLYEPNKSSS